MHQQQLPSIFYTYIHTRSLSHPLTHTHTHNICVCTYVFLYFNSLTDLDTDTEAQGKKGKRDRRYSESLHTANKSSPKLPHCTSALLFLVKDDSGLVSAVALVQLRLTCWSTRGRVSNDDIATHPSAPGSKRSNT